MSQSLLCHRVKNRFESNGGSGAAVSFANWKRGGTTPDKIASDPSGDAPAVFHKMSIHQKCLAVAAKKYCASTAGIRILVGRMKLLAAIAVGFAIGFLVGNAQPKFDLDFLARTQTPTPAPVVAAPTPPGTWMFDKGRTDLDKGAYGQHGSAYAPAGVGATPYPYR